jgi:hypothetical protein
MELIKSLFTQENLEYFFPKFMYSPFRVQATISEVSGVAIEFIEPSETYDIQVKKRHIRIQDAVLPRTSSEHFAIIVAPDPGHAFVDHATLITAPQAQQFVKIGEENVLEFRDTTFVLKRPDKTIAKVVLSLYLFGNNRAEHWTRETARRRFQEDFNRWLRHPVGQDVAIVRTLMALPASVSKQDALDSYERVLDEYDRVLEHATTESEMQEFLKQNPIILEPCAEWIKPKYNIDSVYIPDFVIKQANSYVLVEIEGPEEKLYVRSSGNQRADSAALRRAIVQTEDWQRWIRDTLSAALERLPGISSPEAWVVIGRNASLDAPDSRRLREANETSRGKRIVKTYDDLSERGRAYLANLRKLY